MAISIQEEEDNFSRKNAKEVAGKSVILMDFPIHVDRESMRLPILYFEGSNQVFTYMYDMSPW